jgi:hypothetical protein
MQTSSNWLETSTFPPTWDDLPALKRWFAKTAPGSQMQELRVGGHELCIGYESIGHGVIRVRILVFEKVKDKWQLLLLRCPVIVNEPLTSKITDSGVVIQTTKGRALLIVPVEGLGE